MITGLCFSINQSIPHSIPVFSVSPRLFRRSSVCLTFWNLFVQLWLWTYERIYFFSYCLYLDLYLYFYYLFIYLFISFVYLFIFLLLSWCSFIVVRHQCELYTICEPLLRRESSLMQHTLPLLFFSKCNSFRPFLSPSSSSFCLI